MMKLPQEFKDRMKQMLGEEYAAFEAAYGSPCEKALRINPGKAGREFLERAAFPLTPVPWAEYGYYYDGDASFGKHPYHEAGVYYIQEPSAMAVAEYLDVRPGDRVLDLCAAPGGKSTQIAAKMNGQGILFSNEIHALRAKILSENIERMGIPNAIVTNETPKRLSEFFAGYFDRILVDAPCSGEGMFRKNEAACAQWSMEAVALCAKRQDEILSFAAGMLRPGGKMVYSTCTFAPEENEGSVSRFLKCFPEFKILPAEKKEGMVGGNPAWAGNAAERMEDTVRLFLHRLRGEGHYFALLQKDGEAYRKDFSGDMEKTKAPVEDCREWIDFCRENLKRAPEGKLLSFGDQLYLLPEQAPSLKGIKVIRPGLHLGTKKKNRFEPSHALALYLKKEDVCRSFDLPADGTEIFRYLNGEAVCADGEKGWYLVTTDGYSIGWGKLSGGMMKNHYPKGLRKRLY